MTYKVVDTSEWPAARLDPYWPEIFAAMTKLKARFPDDQSYSVLLSSWVAGRRRLWLVLDQDDKFMAFLTTEIETLVATGDRVVILKDCAGDGVLKAADDICAALEAYADAERIRIRRFTGRDGWKVPAGKHGYKVVSVILEKVVDFE